MMNRRIGAMDRFDAIFFCQEVLFANYLTTLQFLVANLNNIIQLNFVKTFFSLMNHCDFIIHLFPFNQFLSKSKCRWDFCSKRASISNVLFFVCNQNVMQKCLTFFDAKIWNSWNKNVIDVSENVMKLLELLFLKAVQFLM